MNDETLKTDTEITVSDINNLHNLRQQKSRMRIKVDPTITDPSEIQLTNRTSDDGLTQSPSPIEPVPPTPSDLYPSADLDQLCFDTEGTQISGRLNGKKTVNIPSTYVQDRFKDLDTRVQHGRYMRNERYCINCIRSIILNVIGFYILFVIGIFGLIFIFNTFELNLFDSNVSTTTPLKNCICNSSDVSQKIVNNTVIQYIPLSDKYLNKRMENLTLEMYKAIDLYFATIGHNFIQNSTTSIVNKTIDMIQSINLLKLSVNELTTNTIVTQDIDSNTGNINSIVSNNILSDQLTTNTIVTQDIDSKSGNITSIVSNNIISDQLNTNAIVTQDIDSNTGNITSIVSNNIISDQLNTNAIVTQDIDSNSGNINSIVSNNIISDQLNTNAIVTQDIDSKSGNITSIVSNNISAITIYISKIIADIVDSTALFGDTLNKCNVGKC